MEHIFEEFPSISRLSRDCVVTEKIDGTNAQIHITDDLKVLAASRSRYITEVDDNYGFARWVKKNEDELLVKLGIGRHYGEWWGSGIQRGYGLINGDKRFSLFNVHRWGLERPSCCDIVPVLYKGIFDTRIIDEVLDSLNINGSMASPGFAKPEGIVVYHTHSKTLFKKTLDKNDGHKSIKI